MEKIKTIDYKKQRDKALKAMVEFRKMGDLKQAENYLNLAVHINNLAVNPEPRVIPKDCSLI